MAGRAVVTLTEGAKGVGKSFRRGPHFLINDFLPQNTGTCYTNLPVFRDAIARAMSVRTGRDVNEYIERIQMIPADVLKTWEETNKDGTPVSGPWDYFEEVDLNGCHVQLDEMHNYCGSHHHKKHIGRWVEWLGEVRHLGVTVEFISQHVMKMAAPVRREVAVKLYLKTTEDDHDPYFKIKLGDWYELLATLTRRYDVFVVEEESRENRGKWEVVDCRVFLRDPFYFDLYDSYAAPIKGGVKGKVQKREYEKRGKLGMVLWFYMRHWFKLSWRVAFVSVLVWFLGFGGFETIYFGFQNRMMARLGTGSAQAAEVEPVIEATTQMVTSAPSPLTDEPLASAESPSRVVYHVQPQPTIDMTLYVSASEHAAVVAERDQLIARLESLQAHAGKLQRQVEQTSTITLLERERVTFQEGFSYSVGEAIDFGTYTGRVVESIDWDRRTVKLDDGQVLRMGRGGHGNSLDGGGLSDTTGPGPPPDVR